MARRDKVLVGVDGSGASMHALDWACQLASTSELKIRAAMAWYRATSEAVEPPPVEEAAELVKSHLREIVADCADRDVELQVIEQHAVPALVEAGAEEDVCMLVIGRRGLGTLPDLLLGSVARSVLHVPPCPVVLVPSRPDGNWPDPTRVVLAIDGSELSSDIVGFACRLDRLVGITSVVVHCFDVGAEFSSSMLEEVVDRTRRSVTERWCAELDRSGVLFEVDVRNSEPRLGLVEAAQEFEAGLVVVGLHGAGGFRGIGGTTSYLARHLDAPLVVVPPRTADPNLGYRLDEKQGAVVVQSTQ